MSGSDIVAIVTAVPSIIAAIGSLFGLHKSKQNAQAIADNHQETTSAIADLKDQVTAMPIVKVVKSAELTAAPAQN